LLLLIGLNMIRESRLPEEEHHFNPTRLTTQLMLSVATSIDAMAVGVSMALTGFETLHQLVLPLVIIGVGSLLFAVAGQLLGIRFGEQFNRRLKTEAIGGIILIMIGIKIVVSHYISL
jgi:putative Mn2+ efflux pump MntP